ncbi:MAG TPA: protein kinase [Pyrinomonadaceae bacterium]|jgi:predicted Ser/Thr protein kinase|nr:protein kinase [Pyrinomonadaceae bacterium]
MRPRIPIVVTLYALAVAFTAVAYSLYLPQNRLIEDRGWGTAQMEKGGPVVVLAVYPEGPAAAELRVGDEVLALDGENVQGSDYRLEQAYRRTTPGEPYRMTLRREGQTREVTLRAHPTPPRDALLSPGALVAVLYSLSFLAVGLAVFLLRPDDKHALLLSLCFAALGASWAVPYLDEGSSVALRALMAFGYCLKTFFPVFLLHFFLVFPRPLPALARSRRSELYVYLPILLVALPTNLYLAALFLTNVEEFFRVTTRRAALLALGPLLMLGYLLACLVALVAQYRTADRVSKRKLRIILAGCLVGFAPALVFFTTLTLLRVLRGEASAPTGLFLSVNILQTLVPLSFAYAIVRHQVIPVSLIVRRSVQYLLAKNALRLLLLLPVAGLVVSVALDPHRSVADILLRNSTFFYFLLIAAVATGLVFRRRLNEWVDRKFFREQYDQEKILRGLVDEIKGLDSMAEMSRRVSGEVERALHPESVYLFYREGAAGELSLTYTSGGDGRGLNIPEDFQLLRLLELQGGAQDLPFPPKTNLPQHEKDWLRSLGARLVVPLSGTDSRLAGLFLLGQKKSEVPYTARDRELLEAVAGQVALVYENVRLKERAREDRRVQDEVLSRFEGRGVNLLKECPRCGRCFDSTAAKCDADGAELQMTLPVERTVEGRYRLERLVGRGGMGAVYEATHLKLKHRVAVKVLGGRLFGDQRALRRFEREARALARLGQHPNVVSVHDYGELRTEGAFLVMDFIEGESLAALLKRERRLQPQRAADLFEQVLEAVGAAHAAGIVHRDLKPENILVSDDAAGRERVRVLDFGLAKLVRSEGGEAQTMTQPGMVMGTLGYMAPEQLQGEETDERADLFSVGVMVAEALTGRRPFAGRTLFELLRSIEQEAFRLPGESAEARRLEEVLRRCLARSRSRRPASAEELRRELTAALRACPPGALYEDEPLDADTFILPNAPPPASV